MHAETDRRGCHRGIPAFDPGYAKELPSARSRISVLIAGWVERKLKAGARATLRPFKFAWVSSDVAPLVFSQRKLDFEHLPEIELAFWTSQSVSPDVHPAANGGIGSLGTLVV